MKIQHERSTKKRNLIIVSILIAVLFCSGAIWLFYGQRTENGAGPVKSRDESSDTGSKNNNEEDVSGEPTDDTDKSPSEDGDSDTPTSGVSTPSTPPASDEPYPVTNEHFQIRQVSNTNFEITLYPVINNPEYADYNSQLRAYKEEALDYLASRYGSIESFGIDWSPKDAENL